MQIFVEPLQQRKPSSSHDNVNHPSHYTKGKIEVIDFLLDQGMNYLEGNVLKYLTRYKYKNGLEDLMKCKWYLEKLIDDYKNQEAKRKREVARESDCGCSRVGCGVSGDNQDAPESHRESPPWVLSPSAVRLRDSSEAALWIGS